MSAFANHGRPQSSFDLSLKMVTAFTILECATEYLLLLASPGSSPAYFPVLMNVRGLLIQVVAVLLALAVIFIRRLSRNRIPKIVGVLTIGVICASLYLAYTTEVLYGVPMIVVVAGTVTTFLLTGTLMASGLRATTLWRSILVASNLFATLILPWIVAVLWFAR